jgi:hypothetical protein
MFLFEGLIWFTSFWFSHLLFVLNKKLPNFSNFLVVMQPSIFFYAVFSFIFSGLLLNFCGEFRLPPRSRTSRISNFWILVPWIWDPVGCGETSAGNDHCLLRNNPEQRRPHSTTFCTQIFIAYASELYKRDSVLLFLHNGRCSSFWSPLWPLNYNDDVTAPCWHSIPELLLWRRTSK